MLNWFNKRSKKADYSNEEWVTLLSPPPKEVAIAHLRSYLVRGLRSSLYKYVDKDLNDFVEDITQDSVLKILDKVDSFRGESKFTTWAMKIAVREGYTELRKKRYQDISLHDYVQRDDSGEQAVEIEEESVLPDRQTHETLLVDKVMTLMDEALTERQKQALQLLMIEQLPMAVVSEMLNTNRNAVYKLVHDARLKLKNSLELEGISPDEVLEKM